MLSYGRQLIEEDDIASVVEALRGEMLTGGPFVSRFESGLKAATGARHALACANGTAALHLAAMALGIGPGDVVIVPSITFVATANAARYVGAEVVFADVDPQTGLLNEATLAEAAAFAETAGLGRVRAVFPVHLNGQAVAMETVAGFARERGWLIVEDAAHALGTRYGETLAPVGGARHSDAVCFSFHPVKTIAMGEGGAVTTTDDGIAERLARFRNHGLVREPDRFEMRDSAFDADLSARPWYYELPEPGFNYRASDIHCALGVSQLEKLDRFVARRRALVDRYDDLIAPLAPLAMPPAGVPWSEAAWHLYAARIDFEAAGRSRAEVMRALKEHGVGTQVHYIPVHQQPYYRKRYGARRLPGAESYYARQLSLPLFAGMEDGDVDHVVAALGEVLEVGRP